MEIIPDSKEQYTNGGYYYNDVVDAGVLSDGVEILSARRIGSSSNVSPHVSDDIKSTLIESLESGDNNNLSVRLVLADVLAEDSSYFFVGIKTGEMLVIEYDDAVVSDEAYYEAILESFNLEEKAGIDLDNITSDFILPTYYKGSSISWSSDKANITVLSDGVASVTKPSDNDEKVTLTATLSYKDGSSYEKSFEANVIKKSALEKIADNFNSTYKVSDEDYSAITKDIKLDKTFEGATISWVSSNDAVVNSDSGRVIRSESSDVQVALTPTISYGGESKTLNPINLTVKKLTASTDRAPFTTAGVIVGDRILTSDSPGANSDRYAFINFDLTNYLPQIYFANTISLILESGTYGDPQNNPIAVEIVADSKEKYSDFTKSYADALIGGVTEGGTEVYRAGKVGYAGTDHKVDDIKDELIKALESGDNNIISLRVVNLDGPVTLGRYAEFEIKYDSSLATDEAYYKKVTESFDLEEKANVDLDNIKADFKLPTFFKGSKISWKSDKANIAVSSDGTASVTRLASADVTIALTATFSYKDGSSYSMTFKATVPEKTIPVIEAIKNNDGTFSAVIESNEAAEEKYTLYFASYTIDNTLVGLYACPVNGLAEGTTRVDADAEEFLTNGATKIKCILLKGETLTPACKNGEVPN
ncbi:MAG: hypothetical protein IJN40_01515 [Clostridia bacterium]|nr:hypothetical protein [Clostridia bacterium]